MLLLAYAGAGCLLRPPRTIRTVPPGEWQATLGGPARAPFRSETVTESPPSRTWQAGTERGLVAPPVVHGDLLIVGSSGRVLTTVDATNGREYWHRRFNGPVVGSPLRTGDTVLVATAARDGRVYGFTIARGRKTWQRRLHAPVSADPLLHGGRLYAGTIRRELYALDAVNGEVLWRTPLPGILLGAPVLHGNTLLLTTDRDTLVRVDAEHGTRLGAAAMPGTATAPAALRGNQLLVPVHPRSLAVFDANSLALLRLDTLDAPVLAAPALAETGGAWLLTRNGTIWRVEEHGPVRVAELGGAARESLTLARNGLLVGLLDGTLFMLRRDGSVLWRERFPASIRAPVALAGGAAYVSLLNGRIVKLQ